MESNTDTEGGTTIADAFAGIEEEIRQIEEEIKRTGPNIVIADRIVVGIGACDKEATTIRNWIASMGAKIDQISERRTRLVLVLRGTAEHLSKELGKKTVEVPHGKIVLRKKPKHLEIEDAEAVMGAGYKRGGLKLEVGTSPSSAKLVRELAEEQSIPITEDFAVDKKKLNEHFASTGEEVKGTKLIAEEQSITVTAKQG